MMPGLPSARGVIALVEVDGMARKGHHGRKIRIFRTILLACLSGEDISSFLNAALGAAAGRARGCRRRAPRDPAEAARPRRGRLEQEKKL